MPKEGFKDTLFLTTRIKVPVWQRIKNLFCPIVTVEHIVHCTEIMPPHEAVCKITTTSYLDQIKLKLFDQKYHVMYAERPLTEEEILKKKLDSLIKRK